MTIETKEEKKSTNPYKALPRPITFISLPEDLTTETHQYLSSHELVRMKLVGADTNRNEWQYVQSEISARASKMPDIPNVTQEERENIWRIYECFRALEDENEHDPSAEIPHLPPAPADRYAALRHKTQIHELTTQEIELLKLDNLLPSDSFQPSENHTSTPILTLPKPPGDIWSSLRAKRYIGELNREERQLLSSEGLFSAGIPIFPATPIDLYASIRAKAQLYQHQLTDDEIRLLQQANLLPRGFQPHAQIPALPPPPVDPWGTLRNKYTMRELTLKEIHQLFTEGLLDNELITLCRSDCEKASLVMESDFLKKRLPKNELKWVFSPSLFDKALGAFITAILTCFLSLVTGIITLLLYSLSILGNIICCGRDTRSQNENELMTWIFSPLYCITHIIYSFFMGFYLGWKFGIGQCGSISRHFIYDLTKVCHFDCDDNRRGCLPKPNPFFYDKVFKIHNNFNTIANFAQSAERVRKQNSILRLSNGIHPLTAEIAPPPEQVWSSPGPSSSLARNSINNNEYKEGKTNNNEIEEVLDEKRGNRETKENKANGKENLLNQHYLDSSAEIELITIQS